MVKKAWPVDGAVQVEQRMEEGGQRTVIKGPGCLVPGPSMILLH